MIKMGTLNLKYLRYALTTSEGLVTFEIKVPGSPDGGNPKPDFVTGRVNNGRFLSALRVFPGAWTAGDAILSISIVDKDGIIPPEIRPDYPAYPIVLTTVEAGFDQDAGNYILSTGFILDKTTSPIFFPAGLYLNIAASKASGEGTFYTSVSWLPEE